ncbi:MAG: hypothetical protein JKY96_04415 [Phycisphaerales bacterium]|nr:hypothetical protein [Phycisphaerales bacterium]
MLEVIGHRVLIEPKHHTEEIGDGALKGFKMNIGEDWKRDRASTVIGVIKSIGKNAWMGFDDGSPWAKVGDTVYYAKYSGKIVEDDDHTYIIVNDEDIQCIVHERKE